MKEKYEKYPFFFFLFTSLLIHVFFIIIFITSNRLRNLFDRNQNIVTPTAIRVDMVALPDLPSQKKAVQVKKQPVIIPKKQKNKKEKIKKEKIEKKRIKKKKKPEKKESSQKGDSAPSINDPKPEINKGNQLAEGAKKGEEALDSQKMEAINQYLTNITDKIKLNWNLPKYLTELNLMAQIEIQINDRGEMIYKQMLVSSNNDLFDSYVLKATENAAPYSPPPVDVKDFLKGGVVLILSSKD